MKLTNGFVFQYTEELVGEILSDTEIKFPAKVNYIIQRNYQTLLSIAQAILKERINICETYSTGKEGDSYLFEDKEKMEKANQELIDLMSVEQEVNILKFDIDSLGDVMLTNKQMDLLIFMIKGEE